MILVVVTFLYLSYRAEERVTIIIIFQFLNSNGFTLDVSAPALTLPGDVRAPFDSRNTAFNKDTFWSLLLLQPAASFDDKG